MRQISSLKKNVLETLHAAYSLELAFELVQTLNIVARLALLLVIGLELRLEHLHLSFDAKKTPSDDSLTRPFSCVAMLNFLLGHLGKLSDGALEVDGLRHDFAVKVNRITRDFGDHVLLGEVQSLLVKQVNIDIRVLSTVDLAVFRAISRSGVANLELHLVLLFEFVRS